MTHTIDPTDPWLVRVLMGFANAMDGGKADGTPDTLIGWPVPGEFKGRYKPFVWLEVAPPNWTDASEQSQATVVVGVVIKKDPGDKSASELVQALRAYDPMRRSLVQAMENRASDFNAAILGVAFPDEGQGGIKPTGGQDFDGTLAIGERFQVNFNPGAVGAVGT